MPLKLPPLGRATESSDLVSSLGRRTARAQDGGEVQQTGLTDGTRGKARVSGVVLCIDKMDRKIVREGDDEVVEIGRYKTGNVMLYCRPVATLFDQKN